MTKVHHFTPTENPIVVALCTLPKGEHVLQVEAYTTTYPEYVVIWHYSEGQPSLESLSVHERLVSMGIATINELTDLAASVEATVPMEGYNPLENVYGFTTEAPYKFVIGESRITLQFALPESKENILVVRVNII